MQYPGRLTSIFVIVLVIALPSLMIISGQQAWSKQMLLTQRFERCMEKAPFKNPQKLEDSRPTLEPEDMQKHFDEFNQIFISDTNKSRSENIIKKVNKSYKIFEI